MKYDRGGISSQFFEKIPGVETEGYDDFVVEEVRIQYPQCRVIRLGLGLAVRALHGTFCKAFGFLVVLDDLLRYCVSSCCMS